MLGRRGAARPSNPVAATDAALEASWPAPLQTLLRRSARHDADFDKLLGYDEIPEDDVGLQDALIADISDLEWEERHLRREIMDVVEVVVDAHPCWTSVKVLEHVLEDRRLYRRLMRNRDYDWALDECRKLKRKRDG